VLFFHFLYKILKDFIISKVVVKGKSLYQNKIRQSNSKFFLTGKSLWSILNSLNNYFLEGKGEG